MRLLEYQAKQLFSEFGIKIPKGLTSKDVEQGRKDAEELGFPFVIKSQVPVGGRGKVGAIQKCHNQDEFNLKYPQILEMSVKGEKTRAILLEKMAEIKKELYLSLFLNRGKRCYTIIASSEGGVEIESVKNQVIREVGLGDVDKQVAEEVAKEIGLKGNSVTEFVDMLQKLSRLTIEKEAELAEINPVAVLNDGSLIALDGKVITDHVLYIVSKTHIEPALENDLFDGKLMITFTLIELDGNIAVIGNGAGLVMSTLDMLSDNGGKAACF